jgi:RNA polymerase sigma-B factor
MVRSIARRYETAAIPTEDLVQVGYIGLIHAVDRFDPARGVPLRAYASRMIEGEILHAIRDQSWVVRMPRSLQETSHLAAATRGRLEQTLGRRPTVEEIAADTSMTVAEVQDAFDALTALRTRNVSALSEYGDDEDSPPVAVAITSEDPSFEWVLNDTELRQAMRGLSARDREILELRIFEDLTQSEIAARFGISQMHVSRILRRAGQLVRDRLQATA